MLIIIDFNTYGIFFGPKTTNNATISVCFNESQTRYILVLEQLYTERQEARI